MRYYQLTFLISPDSAAEDIQKQVRNFLEKEGAVLDREEPSERIRLGYPIKKREDAYLSALYFHCEPDKLSNLRKKINDIPEVLRYMILTERISKAEAPKETIPVAPKQKLEPKKAPKKVELKEIEKKLDEILK